MATAEPEQRNEQELRLALALRGGTSLAVWMGGAVSEINTLRTAMAAPDPELGDGESPAATEQHPWAVLAQLVGYSSVSVDVLAGASAGGLNGALLAASVVYGMPFDRTRQTWIAMADAEAMARPTPKFWQRRPPSLLEGDAYFRPEVAHVLSSGIPRAGRARALGDRLDLLLTATLLDPVTQRRFDRRSELITEQRRQAWFRFRHRGRPGLPLSDFGADGDREASLQRLAEAARTTASFPGAFEPARVYSCPPPSPEPNLFGLFSESTEQGGDPFRVIDGGVLDNIPIEDAVRAIAAAEADRPTERWLLYLNPAPEAMRSERIRASALPVALAAEHAQMSQQSVLADLDALDGHNRAVRRTALRRKALFAELRSTPQEGRREALARQAAAALHDHAVVRAELDVLAVAKLFTDTHEADGWLLPPVVGDPLASWSAQARTRLPGRIAAHLTERAAGDPRAVFTDVRALLSAIEECLGWAEDIQPLAQQGEAEEIGRCKVALYRLRVFGNVLAAHADRYWINGAQLEPIVEVGELDGWVRLVARRHQRLQRDLPSPVRPLLGAVLTAVSDGDDERFQRVLAEFAAELLSIVDSSGADAVSDNGMRDAHRADPVADAVDVLHRIAARLAYVAGKRGEQDDPEQIGYALLERAAPDERPAVLYDLVVLTAPLDVGRSPGSVINFLRIVSDEQTPLPFTTLRGSDSAPLRVVNKIRGQDLGDFGAFLSAKWRANDWMWGRLDATATLVRLLLDPRRLARQNSSLGADGVASALESVVSRPTTAELGDLDEQKSRQWRGFLTDLWAEHAGEVRSELSALFQEPDGDHPLPRTTDLLIERLQWTIAAREIPYVAAVDEGADPMGGEKVAVSDPQTLENDLHRYSVGKQRLTDLGEQRVASIATRFALIGFRAVLPSGSPLKWLAKFGMLLCKPLLMTLAFALAAPTRAATVGFLAAAATALTGPGGLDVADLSGRSFGPAVVLAMALAVAGSGWLGWQLAGRAQATELARLGRWPVALGIAIILLAIGFSVFSTGFRLGQVGLALVAVLLTWPATLAYRPEGRAAATAVTVVAFAAVLAVASPGGGGWILAALLVCGYLHMVLVGSVDVLRPRPRSLRGTQSPSGRSAPAATYPTGDRNRINR